MSDDPAERPIDLPIDGTLDLHTFSPREIGDLIPGYLDECRARGIDQVRIVHGKGTGALRRAVLALLRRLPGIREIRTAGEDAGGWGATIVLLQRRRDGEGG
jgi:DNA-nicking Smr family endonuclease